MRNAKRGGDQGGPARCDDDPEARCVTDADCGFEGSSQPYVSARTLKYKHQSTCVYQDEKSCSQGSDCEADIVAYLRLRIKWMFGVFLFIRCYTRRHVCQHQDCEHETCILF